MRAKLVRAVVAGAVAVAVGVAGAARAAAAETPRTTGGDVSIMAFDWVGAIIAVAGAALNSGGGSGDLDAAVRQIIAAVEASEQEILNHIDGLASAEVKACARTHTIEFSDIDNMSPTVRQLWAQNATSCAALATAYLEAVQSRPAADAIGLAIAEIYAIAIGARARANLVNGIDLLVRDQIRSYETLVVKLVPSCSHRWEFDDNPRHIYPVYITCEAYPGKVGTDMRLIGYLPGRPEPRVPYERAIANTDALTSRGVAIAALPRLRTLPV
ncbi:hypothetical protein AAH979_32395 [Plantactinospora sp. ZYX-F-223]|uniref:hypothetical protein n=1 Tax=Plantactinospora sp. ZYX-F-223 TaxID=3144103 RepID=UPI0031FD3AAF